MARSITPLTLQASQPPTTPAHPAVAPTAAPAHVQRTPEFAGHEATGQFSETTVNREVTVDEVTTSESSSTGTPSTSELSAITEHVWREIRRRLRIERERSRGVM